MQNKREASGEKPEANQINGCEELVITTESINTSDSSQPNYGNLAEEAAVAEIEAQVEADADAFLAEIETYEAAEDTRAVQGTYARSSGAQLENHPAHDPALVSRDAIREMLETKPGKGKQEIVLDSYENLDLIFANDADLTGLSTNTLSSLITWTTVPSWRNSDSLDLALTDSDLDFISRRVRWYFGGGVRSIGREHVTTAMRTYAGHPTRCHNPWVAYLESLPAWDGTPRLATAIPTVDETPYTRAVLQNVYLSLITRTYEPGAQVDSMLVLVSAEQGLHKTSWVISITKDIPGLPEITPLGSIPAGDRDKDITAQRHQGVISLFDELDQLSSKSDQKALKSDITQRSDVWRDPYARVSGQHKRRFISIGTTNDDSFLTDETGGRRYWPLTITDVIPDEVMTREYQDLLLAEALARYNAGERLDFSESFEMLANDIRAESTYNPIADTLDVWLDNPISTVDIVSREIGERQYIREGQRVSVERVSVAYLAEHAGLTPSAMQMSKRDISSKIKIYMNSRGDYVPKKSLRGVPGCKTPVRGWEYNAAAVTVTHVYDSDTEQEYRDPRDVGPVPPAPPTIT